MGKNKLKDQIIGNYHVLHLKSDPISVSGKPDEFRLIKIIETKPVKCGWTGKSDPSYIGWKAEDSKGRIYYNNWSTFATSSSDPRCCWYCEDLDKSVEIFWEVTKVVVPFKPTFNHNLVMNEKIDWCEKHYNLFYREREKCFYCEHNIQRDLEFFNQVMWNGWR